MKKDASAPPVVGIDLGGTNMQIGVVDAANRIIGRTKMKTLAEEGHEAVLDRLAQGVEKACDKADVSIDDITALGLAAAGAMDIDEGVILHAPNLGWRDLPLRDLLGKRVQRPVILENDVNAAAWGEYHAGAGKGEGDMLGVWVGTGIGAGVVLNRTLYHGELGTAGEIGMTIIEPCGAPGRARLEEFASRTGMSRTILARLHAYPDSILNELVDPVTGITGSKKVKRAYESGDELAVEVVHQAAALIGVAIANVVTMLSLDIVILGGGVSEALGKPWLDRIRARFDEAVFPDKCRRECRIVPTQLEDDAGLLGAAMIARDNAGKRVRA